MQNISSIVFTNKYNKFISMILLITIFIFLIGGIASTAFFPGETRVDEDGNLALSSNQDNSSMEDSWNYFIMKYSSFITGLSGIGALTMLLFFIINFSKLGVHSSNPNERQRIIGTLIFTGVSTACLGALSLVVGIFYNVFS